VPEGYSITWTTDVGGVPPSSNDAATITLTSTAFEACTAISKVSDTTPGATGGLLSGSGVTLGTPDLGRSKRPYTVTWLLKCPPNVSIKAVTADCMPAGHACRACQVASIVVVSSSASLAELRRVCKRVSLP
jgi:hypothetical protein